MAWARPVSPCRTLLVHMTHCVQADQIQSPHEVPDLGVVILAFAHGAPDREDPLAQRPIEQLDDFLEAFAAEMRPKIAARLEARGNHGGR